MSRYVMVIDTARCIGCNACAMACKTENNLPDGVWWNRAKTEGGEADYTPSGTYPSDLSMYFYTYSCQHCSEPACVEICPTGASHVDEETGVVLVDYEECIGCESCISACPYEGVRTRIEGDPAYTLDFAVGDADVQEHVGNVVEKCTFCHHRLVRGEQPACVGVCRYKARYFGDADDPDSKVSQLLAEREHMQLLTDQGTGPNVYYLK